MTLVMVGLSLLFYCIVSSVQCLLVSHELYTRCSNPRATRNGILDAGAVWVWNFVLDVFLSVSVVFFTYFFFCQALLFVKLLVILSPFPYSIFLVALAGRSNNHYTRSESAICVFKRFNISICNVTMIYRIGSSSYL